MIELTEALGNLKFLPSYLFYTLTKTYGMGENMQYVRLSHLISNSGATNWNADIDAMINKAADALGATHDTKEEVFFYISAKRDEGLFEVVFNRSRNSRKWTVISYFLNGKLEESMSRKDNQELKLYFMNNPEIHDAVVFTYDREREKLTKERIVNNYIIDPLKAVKNNSKYGYIHKTVTETTFDMAQVNTLLDAKRKNYKKITQDDTLVYEPEVHPVNGRLTLSDVKKLMTFYKGY